MAEPFFVVGCGRSGTTLLRSTLVRHPRVQIPGETHYVPLALRLAPTLDRLPAGQRTAAIGRVLSANRRLALSGIDEPNLISWLVKQQVENTAEAICSVYELYWELNGAPLVGSETSVLGDKTPSYVLRIPQLAKAFPESRFVHIIRDGREVARSIERMPWGPASAEGGLAHWERVVRRGRSGSRHLPTRRYLEVSYEALLAEPVAELTKVCAFLDLDFNAVMLDVGQVADKVAAQNFFPETHARLSGPIVAPDRVQQAKLPLSVGQSGLLEELGYDLDGTPPAPKWSELRSRADDRISTGPISVARLRTIGGLVSKRVGARAE